MTLYRIDLTELRYPSDEEHIDEAIRTGVLVLVEPCKHGNTKGHVVVGGKLPVQKPNGDFVWCVGVGEETP